VLFALSFYFLLLYFIFASLFMKIILTLFYLKKNNYIAIAFMICEFKLNSFFHFFLFFIALFCLCFFIYENYFDSFLLKKNNYIAISFMICEFKLNSYVSRERNDDIVEQVRKCNGLT
jgi:hypothetical protein